MHLLVTAVAAIAALAAVDQLFLWMERPHEHVVEQQETQERLADIQGEAAPR